MELKECARCGKIFARDLLGPSPDGMGLIRWDRRPKGPVGWRIGVPDEGKMLAERVVLACAACGGRVAPPPPPPLWRAARDAWAEAARTDPALARLAPRPRRRV